MYVAWNHQHVVSEWRQMITGFNNHFRMVRNFRQTVSDCPYGINCPAAYPKISYWPTPPPIVEQALSPPLSPATPLPSPKLQDQVWLPKDIVEFNTPSSEFNEVKIEPFPMETNRVWEQIGDGNLASDKIMRIKLMSYNVLSQTILDSNQIVYSSCRQEDLVWEARWEKIFNEVLTMDPDIFCLQEVQVSHLSFYARFQSIGYMGVFKKKTRYKPDGCAVFYKSPMFKMIDKTAVEFRYEDIPFLRADSIGVIVKLVPNASPNTQLVVATTHLLYMPDEAATRLAQMRILLHEIEKFSYDEAKGQLPFILTGDFNALPQSNVIKFLEEGQIRIPLEESLERIGISETEEINWMRLDTAVDGANATNDDIPDNPQICKIATHPFKLYSVYDNDSSHGRWATVDHIYFTGDLTVVERLSAPTTSLRRKIPNEIYGSDHMSTAAVFEMVLE